jgi:hypothetical protein
MTTGTDYMVIWHAPNPRILAFTTSLESARRIASEESRKHKMFLVNIYKEIES